jgi:glutaminyl-tRNA synthetase
VPFGRQLWIEEDDFAEVPPPGWHRLAPGAEVRLRYAYVIRCTGVVKDDAGEVVELRCTYDPATRGGHAPDGRKVRGTIHWVSAAHAVPLEVRLYDHLFTKEDPGKVEEGGSFLDNLNSDSVQVVTGQGEPSLAAAAPGERVQFERLGYFCTDSEDHSNERPAFNRTATLRDTWAKLQKRS